MDAEPDVFTYFDEDSGTDGYDSDDASSSCNRKGKGVGTMFADCET